jgi:hypothetical protein
MRGRQACGCPVPTAVVQTAIEERSVEGTVAFPKKKTKPCPRCGVAVDCDAIIEHMTDVHFPAWRYGLSQGGAIDLVEMEPTEKGGRPQKVWMCSTCGATARNHSEFVDHFHTDIEEVPTAQPAADKPQTPNASTQTTPQDGIIKIDGEVNRGGWGAEKPGFWTYYPLTDEREDFKKSSTQLNEPPLNTARNVPAPKSI